MSLPIPVPSEAIDFTPPELWGVYWEHYPQGVELPACVPRDVWDRQWTHRNKQLAMSMKPPPPPQLLKNYWNRLQARAFTNRRRAKDSQEEPLPPVLPPTLSKNFWKQYLDIFPSGHKAPPAGQYVGNYAGNSAFKEEQVKYKFIGGTLHVCTGEGRWTQSNGCDVWDQCGNWLGPG